MTAEQNGLSEQNRALVERVLPDNAAWHLSECIYMAVKKSDGLK